MHLHQKTQRYNDTLANALLLFTACPCHSDTPADALLLFMACLRYSDTRGRLTTVHGLPALQ